MALSYEYIVEQSSNGEIENTEYFLDYRKARKFYNAATQRGETVQIALMRDHSADGREWAYVTDEGRLPVMLVDAEGRETRRVPNKYVDEVNRGQCD
jgi:acyl carrier protein phosphodiesterase